MNAETRNQYPTIRPEQWQQLGYLDSDSLGPSTLSKDVHPLLSFSWRGREKWDCQHSGLTEERTHELLLPGLRLVSEFMLSPPGIAHFHAIFYGHRQELRDLTTQLGGKHKQYSFHPLEGLDPNTAREEVTTALMRLERVIEFEFADRSTDTIFRTGGARAMTRATRNNEEINILEDERCRGIASRITIDPRFVAALEEAHSRPDNTGYVLSVNFNFAKNTYHELQHVAALAVNSDVLSQLKQMQSMSLQQRLALGPLESPEPYLEGQQIAELGCSGEQLMFGGKIDWEFGNVDAPTWIYDWPSLLNVEQFQRGPGPEMTAKRYLVSMRYMRRVQQQAFVSPPF